MAAPPAILYPACCTGWRLPALSTELNTSVIAVNENIQRSVGRPPAPNLPEVLYDWIITLDMVYVSASNRPPCGPVPVPPGRLTRTTTVGIGSPPASLPHRIGVLLSM